MKIKSIHFVGIKGVGMTPLAIIAKEAGIKVTGSDIPEQFITDELLEKAGIEVESGFSAQHVGKPDLVITTGAHGGFENEEVIEAKKKGINVITQGEAVGSFMNGVLLNKKYVGISVAGSHGKTTTTAMIATVLKQAGMDPAYVIGTGAIPSLGLSGHFGKGDYFVAEADEYVTSIGQDVTPKLLWQHPKIAALTNIEFDHPDVYKDEEAVKDVFLQFLNQVPPDGASVVCGDDPGASSIAKKHAGRIITYGNNPKNDYFISRSHVSQPFTFFQVKTKETDLGEFSIAVPGSHNVLNALCALVVSLEAGIGLEQIKKGLKAFSGTKRRSEFVGKTTSGALLYDDYAHHPTEIKKTLQAFRNHFPKSKIVCIFQPHMYSRTKSLFEQFIHSFSDTDTVILTDIYPSLRETADPSVSSKVMFERMQPYHKQTIYLSSLPDVVKYVGDQSYGGNTIVITMGAGDVYKIGERLKIKD